MDMEQQFQQGITPIGPMKGDGTSLSKCRSISPTIDGSSQDDSSIGGGSGFDCNICLDCVQEPVVTLCGHLYCWPCIYKWIKFQGSDHDDTDETLEHQKHPQCPVCKAEVSKDTLIPLYGRGTSAKPSEGKAPHLGITVPKRPPSMACGFTSTSPLPHRGGYPPRSQQYRPQGGHHFPSTATAATTMDLIHPMSGMIGEMVYARMFGNSTRASYGYPDLYRLGENATPRLRRHLMQTDQSLGRVCFFLFCCVVLCLLLF